MSAPILPGATLGLLGGGQLGRYFTVAARQAGYEVIVLDPDPEAPAGHFATRQLVAAYDDLEALEILAAECAAITTEFENPPASAMQRLEERLPGRVRPSAAAVAIAQNRILEKRFFKACGLPTGPLATIEAGEEIDAALSDLPFPAIIKTARFGYDGKGQMRVASKAEALTILQSETNPLPCVVESFLDLDREISVLLGRSVDGEIAFFPVADNTHRDGILDVSILPAQIDEALAEKARGMARLIAEKLDYVGVLAVEFFVLKDGSLALNEMAPRPHNSGHATLDAGSASQFDQQLRTVCGFPPLDPTPFPIAVMVNLLGDLWGKGAPRWESVLKEPQAHLHLYGKKSARPGRKMGHLTVTGRDRDTVVKKALLLREALQS
jgi:5-(carboxyamino)imidazole ribonucleotide synthase